MPIFYWTFPCYVLFLVFGSSIFVYIIDFLEKLPDLGIFMIVGDYF